MTSSKGPTFERFYFRGSNCTLSAVDYGNRDKPAMIIVHGMRDHALSMTPISAEFGAEYHIVVPDLRGHGDSDNPGSYTMIQFIADLRALVNDRALERPVLVGHSLGGHITSKYAAIYPDDVSRLILIDGMGPPRPPVEVPEEMEQQAWRTNVENMLALSSQRRALADEAEALSRLMGNNPKLPEADARRIVHHGIEPHPDGGVRWKWDPAINMVWNTFEHRESERQWTMIRCPVLVVTGEDSMRYWTGRNLSGGFDTEAHQREMQRRLGLFRDARHEEITGAGHMIHYDEPAALNRTIRRFLEDNY